MMRIRLVRELLVVEMVWLDQVTKQIRVMQIQVAVAVAVVRVVELSAKAEMAARA